MSTTAIAAPPVKQLQVTPVHVGAESGNGRQFDLFRVIAATPTLSAQIDRQIADTARVPGWLGGNAQSPEGGDINCQVTFATSVLVGWHCHGLIQSSNGSAQLDDDATYAIDEKTHALVPLKIEMVLAKGVTLAGLGDKLKGESTGGGSDGAPCSVSAAPTGWGVSFAGLEVFGEESTHGCVLAWSDLKGKLAADGVVARALAAMAADGAPTESTASWAAEPRFVPEAGDTVRDKATGLLWTAHDNGKDLTWDAAQALAKAKGAGWRLPTEAELEDLVSPEQVHKEPTDCTKGKNGLLISPAIHLSCGLVWGDSVDASRAIGVGFISGTPRISKMIETKNYRALLVRK